MRVLVTGANGFVGRHLVHRLHADGWEVVVALRQPATIPGAAASVIVPSIDGGSDWSAALRGVDAVVHCAAHVPGVPTRAAARVDSALDDAALFESVNVQGTAALASQAVQAGVKRFVFLSSVKVHGEATSVDRPFRAADAPAPEDAYGRSKRDAEAALRAAAAGSAMETVIVRPPLVYGPGNKGNIAALMRGVERGIPLPLGSVRHNRRSLVAVQNLVDFLGVCLRRPAAANEAFLISDDDDVSTTELLLRIGTAVGRPTLLLPLPTFVLHSAAALLGKGDVARRLLGSLRVDVTPARTRLGWRPVLPMQAALRETAQHSQSVNAQ